MVTLTAVKALLEDFAINKILVVAPLRVAATVWAEEAAKWDHLQPLRVVKVLGSRQEREAALREDADIYVINRENVAWLVEYYAPTRKWPFDMLVLDELSSFKSPKAERFKALKRTLPAVRRVVGLTGTPAPNGLIDLWSQIYLLDGGERLGKFVGNYRNQYFRPGHTNGMVVYNWVLLDGAADRIYEKIGDICMSMKARDYLDMPDRVDIKVPVRLSEASRTAYETMERDLVLPLRDEAITAQNAAVLAGKLLQLAGGGIYKEDGVEFIRIHDSKLDALEDLIEAANGEPVLIYYGFRHEKERIQQRFPEAKVLFSPMDVKAWNRGEIPIMLAHPASAGHGLNLQQGGHIVIWYGLTWSLEQYQQANARLYRQGQEKPVMIYHLIAEGTVDEDVMKVLENKETRQDFLIDAVKARIDRYES